MNTLPDYFFTRAAEEKLGLLFSEAKPFSEHLVKWEDNALPDKYDHNCFAYSAQPTREEYEKALAYQQARGDAFLKLEGGFPLTDPFGMEESVTLTMLLKGGASGWKKNEALRFAEPSLEELEAIEVKHFGPLHGEDFSRRNIRRLYGKLEFHGAYLDGALAGACYTFTVDGLICIDGLIVEEACRRRYVATSLLAYVAGRAGGRRLFLHADEEDTPKEMYRRLGFETVDRLYEYFRVIRTEEPAAGRGAPEDRR